MRVLVAPLEFKGTLSAREVADAIAEGLLRARPELVVEKLPLADGGPGTVDAIASALPQARRHTARVEDPLGREVEASFVVEGDTAFIELASAAGLHLLSPGERDALRASTFGVGQLIRAALEQGCHEVVLGLGGSATNDAGAGALQALGVELIDPMGRPIDRGGLSLRTLAAVDSSRRDPRLRALLLATDVTSPLLGPTGASRLFAPQKGATPDEVEALEAALTHFAEVAAEELAATPGAGAAGGTAFGLRACLGATLRSGFEVVAEHVRLDDAIARVDQVLTGEGRFDEQSLLGKGPVQLARRSHAAHKPITLFAGSVTSAGPSPFDAVVLAPGPESSAAARAALIRAAEAWASSQPE